MLAWSSALEIPPAQLAELEMHARGAYPQECCGILIGTPGESGVRSRSQVTALWPAGNIATGDRAKRYSIAPEVLLQAYMSVRGREVDVIGYYHSHPDSGAEPSDRDLAEAAPGVSYLIVAVSGREILELRSWRLRGDRSCFDEQQIL